MARKKSRRRNPLGRDNPDRKLSVSKATTLALPSLSLRKKLLFAVCTTLVVFFVLELLLWISGVEPSYYQYDPYAGFSTHIPHFVSTTDEEGRSWMTVVPSKERVLNQQRFLSKKPSDTYRIVCVGGSTTYGRPFFDRTSWAGWLRAMLPVADALQDWEVINVGAISYASYRAEGLMEEMTQYKPDLFIVYTGHNEFLERRTYGKLAERSSQITDLLALVSRTRTSTLVRKSIDLLGIRSSRSSARTSLLGSDVQAIPIDVVGPEAYKRDPQLAQDIGVHFRSTLLRMTQIANRAGADILFVVPAANLLEFPPLKSQHRAGLTESQQLKWRGHFDQARFLASAGQHERALSDLAKAEKIDDQYAELFYLKGRTLQTLKRYRESEQALLHARDLDICPLRAISPLLKIVREMASTDTGGLVDFEQLVREKSEHGLPGHAMFHDHVHPTVEANRLLGVALVSALQDRGIVRLSDSWNAQTIAQVTQQVQSQINRPLCAQQLRALAALLASLGQLDQAQYQGELSLELSGRTPSVLQELASGLQAQEAWDVAAEYFQEAIDLAPDQAASHLGLGLCRIQQGWGKQGAEQLRIALKLNSNLATAHTHLGIWLAGQGQLADAEVHFAKAAKLRPLEADSFSNWGLAIAEQGRANEALIHYHQALALDPHSPSVHFNLGLALEQLGKTDAARTHYKSALQSDPSYHKARTKLRAMRVVPQ